MWQTELEQFPKQLPSYLESICGHSEIKKIGKGGKKVFYVATQADNNLQSHPHFRSPTHGLPKCCSLFGLNRDIRPFRIKQAIVLKCGCMGHFRLIPNLCVLLGTSGYMVLCHINSPSRVAIKLKHKTKIYGLVMCIKNRETDTIGEHVLINT